VEEYVIDNIIVDGLKGYVDVKNIALKDQRNEGKFILGGKLKSTPANVSQFELGLSLGMTALNESGGESLAAPIPDSPVNRQLYSRLVDHFKGHTKHGLRSALAGMGLESEEKQLFTVRDREADSELMDRTARRAADRAMELIAGRQRTAGYPTTAIPIVGGHQIGRATSQSIGYPEQILHDNNMEVEGALEGQVRHEYRGSKASELAGKKLVEFLASDEVDHKTALKILDTLVAVQEGDDPRFSREAVLKEVNNRNLKRR
jgi:hypothetical protein